MSHWILAIDVGNSRIKVGLFDDDSQQRSSTQSPDCLKQVGFPLGEHWDARRLDWPELGKGSSIRGIIAGANPQGIDKVINGWPSDIWGTPRIITHGETFPLTIDVEAPRQVGIDRLLNAVAVNRMRPDKQAAIIVDSGTATTVDFVSKEGHFCGGAILPGFELCARALHQYTALLPLIAMDELIDHVPREVGTNTRSALQSGLYWGQVGAVRELVSRLMSGRADEPEPLCILTGGGGPMLHEPLGSSRWLLKPCLALEGLVIVDREMSRASA